MITRSKCYGLGLALLLCLGASEQVSAKEPLEKEVAKRISETSRSLQNMEMTISRASQNYQQSLGNKEAEVKALREQAAALQRMADEQLLSIEDLERRVEQWSAQSKYQRHLLASFINAAELPAPVSSDAGAELFELDVLTMAHQQALSKLAPAWREASIITPSGEIRTMPVLGLGPVEVALDSDAATGGLIDSAATGDLVLLDVLDQAALSQLQALRQTGQGEFTFDPTLGNALKLRGTQTGVWQHLQTGGIWAIPIVFFGLLALVIALLKALQLLRLPKVQTELADAELAGAAGHKTRARAPLGKVQRRLLEIAKSVPVSPLRDDLLVACLMENRHGLERFMGVIATTAAVAPLLGLLGTVSGMISTFKMMTIFGSGDATTVSGGISEALVTTELGLIVAIPALVISALLTRRIRSYTHKLEAYAVKLSKTPAGG